MSKVLTSVRRTLGKSLGQLTGKADANSHQVTHEANGYRPTRQAGKKATTIVTFVLQTVLVLLEVASKTSELDLFIPGFVVVAFYAMAFVFTGLAVALVILDD